MQRIIVHGGGPLAGAVPIAGAKNSALKLMAATLLTEGRHVIDNVPRIVDVEIMSDVLTSMGVTVTREADARLVIDCPEELVPTA